MYLNHSWIAYETMNVDPFPASRLQPSALPVPSMPLRPAPAALPYGGAPQLNSLFDCRYYWFPI